MILQTIYMTAVGCCRRRKRIVCDWCASLR